MPGPAPASTSAQGAATRLLVLGCVRIFQPVHGYFLRRELASWEIESWAHVHPGSIYNALKMLTKAGLLAEIESPAGVRPQRTTYVITREGDEEFLALVRAGLLDVDDLQLFLTAVNMSYALPRDEVVRTIQTRIGLLEDLLARRRRTVEEILEAKDTPDFASEVGRLLGGQVTAEIAWAHEYLGRLRSGAYGFEGEPPIWTPTPAQVEAARLAGVGPGVLLAEEQEHGLR